MKNYSISIIRSIAVCMIVSCHIFQGLNVELAYWMNVGVQIFLCMSGYLYGKKDIKDIKKWYIRQYLKIMIPVWVILTCLLIILSFCHNESISLSSVVFSYLGVAGFQTLPELTHTWFITYILFCYLITPLLERIDIISGVSEWKFLFYLASIIICLEVLYMGKIVSVMPQYVAVYIIGYYLSHNEKIKGIYVRKIYIKLFGILTVVLFPIRLLIQYGNLKIENGYWNILRGQIIDWHHLLIGISLFIFLLSFIENRKIESNSIKAVNYLDKYSYYIYLVHQIFILNTFSLLNFTRFLFLNLIMIVVAIAFSSYILSKLTQIINIRLGIEK